MKLIMIHGIAQGGRDANELKQEWIDALNRGLEGTGKSITNDSVKFPYYGDLVGNFYKEAGLISKPNILTRSSSNTVDETEEEFFLQELLKELLAQTNMTNEEKLELKKNTEQKRFAGEIGKIIAKQPWVYTNPLTQYLISAIEKKVDIGHLLLFQREVFGYLFVPEIKSKIHEEVLKYFDNEPCVVVGHSLGSVIAYSLLRRSQKFNIQCDVKYFITLGSPLGIQNVKNLIDTPFKLNCLKGDWFNAYDDRDIVALNPLDSRHFNIQPPIENYNKVDNFTENKHSIEGYLENKIVAQRIHYALTYL